MLKISIIETRSQRKLVIEGKLLHPWTKEVECAWGSAGKELDGRKLVIDLAHVTLISPEGENMLLDLIRAGAKFTCEGVFTRHVLKELLRRGGCTP